MLSFNLILKLLIHVILKYSSKEQNMTTICQFLSNFFLVLCAMYFIYYKLLIYYHTYIFGGYSSNQDYVCIG